MLSCVEEGFKKMDIISQLQEQVNTIAAITFNAFGTLQRDAPPVQLSPNYPEPPATTTATDDATAFPEQPKQLSAGLVKAAKQVIPNLKWTFETIFLYWDVWIMSWCQKLLMKVCNLSDFSSFSNFDTWCGTFFL